MFLFFFFLFFGKENNNSVMNSALKPIFTMNIYKKDALSTRQLDRIQQTDSVASIHDNNIS